MILQTGPTKRVLKKALNKSFTLIELLIVTAIILTLVSVSMPLFRRTFTDLELKEAAADISKFILFAQHEAIINGAVYKIDFDFEKKEYRLLAFIGEVEKGGQFKSEGGRFSRIFHLPEGVDIEGQVTEILFYPDGHSDSVELKLTNKNGKILKISTTGILGNVVIEEEKL